MIDDTQPAVKKLRERYPHIHVLIFQRSLERATTLGHLFDILESFPDKFPVVWDFKQSRWVSTDDITQRERIESNEGSS